MLAPTFRRLIVTEYRRETSDAVSLTFQIPEEYSAEFSFSAGQYLTLRAFFDGKEARRAYSICSSPYDDELRIAVKRISGGLFSNYIIDDLKVGDSMDVLKPTGQFGVRPPATGVFAAFASGSGITPILSIAKSILAGDEKSTFSLFYGNRRADTILFGKDLADLKDRYLSRLGVTHFLSGETQDLSFLNGRLDSSKVEVILTACLPATNIEQVFICGPESMGEAVVQACVTLGITKDRIHTERFVSGVSGRNTTTFAPKVDYTQVAKATLIVDGKQRSIGLCEGESILDAAIRAGIELPYACKGGMCATCRAKIVDGEVTMDTNYSLDASEIASGFTLTCQATANSAHIVVDFDAV